MGLKPLLLKGIAAFGFAAPSAVQQMAVAPIVRGRDVVVQSQAGTGKTGVFAVAALQIVKEAEKRVQVVVLSPTRELAEQTARVVAGLGDFMGIKVRACVGKRRSSSSSSAAASASTKKKAKRKSFTPPSDHHDSSEEEHALRRGEVQVVSGTPGRVRDLMERGLINGKRVDLLVVDEADEMIEGGFGEEVRALYEKHLRPGVQVVLVSATMPRDVVQLADVLVTNPVRVLVKSDKELSLSGVAQFFVELEKEEWKFDALCDLYESLVVAQAVVFVNTKQKAEWLAEELSKAGFAVGKMHGGMSQHERDEAMGRFRVGSTRVLVATDLWGRGLDVQQVALVVNYDVPTHNEEVYVHRVGRSGRFGRKGVAVTFIVPSAGDAKAFSSICRKFGVDVRRLPRDVESVRRALLSSSSSSS